MGAWGWKVWEGGGGGGSRDTWLVTVDNLFENPARDIYIYIQTTKNLLRNILCNVISDFREASVSIFRPLSQFFPIRTSQPVNIIYIYIYVIYRLRGPYREKL